MYHDGLSPKKKPRTLSSAASFDEPLQVVCGLWQLDLLRDSCVPGIFYNHYKCPKSTCRRLLSLAADGYIVAASVDGEIGTVFCSRECAAFVRLYKAQHAKLQRAQTEISSSVWKVAGAGEVSRGIHFCQRCGFVPDTEDQPIYTSPQFARDNWSGVCALCVTVFSWHQQWQHKLKVLTIEEWNRLLPPDEFRFIPEPVSHHCQLKGPRCYGLTWRGRLIFQNSEHVQQSMCLFCADDVAAQAPRHIVWKQEAEPTLLGLHAITCSHALPLLPTDIITLISSYYFGTYVSQT